MNVLDTRCDASCFCFLSQNQSDSGDSGRWNIASINVPQRSSSNSLNLSEDDPRELCSERRVAAPLPLLPLLPLPCPGRLGSVVAGMLCPPEGTLWCTDVDLMIGQSFGVDNK